MRENDLFSNEFPQRPEHDIAPEHSTLPEYNPVYPDITFFKESSVTCREENIFQGRPPEGEPDLRSRREERKKRSKYSILQKFLGSAIRGGAAVLCAALVVAVITSDGDDGRGIYASKIANAVNSAKRPAFTQQSGYGADEFARLWEGDPDAPHKYDIEDPSAVKEPTCTEEGEADYVCTACGIHVHYAIPAKGHTAGDPVIQNETAATCTEEGSYEEIINCTVCGEELSRRTVAVAATGHTAGEPERENEAAATCTEGGSYEDVVYCSVCGEEISREPVIAEALGHNAAAPEKENEKAATCTEGGSYEEVIYCSRCGEEISRNTVRTAALGHTAAAAVREKETAATCTAGGHYDNVVYCSVCGEEMSREPVIAEALGHNAAAPEKENEKESTCNEGGSYEEVTYCSRCGEEISRTTVRTAALGHTAAAPVREKETAATCTAEGSYEEVVLCTVCGEELSRRTVAVAATGHTAGEPERENEAAATCTEGGHYDNVVYCSVCGEEMSRSTVNSAALGHSASASVTENGSEATCTESGHYDSVVYCSTCGEELSRTEVTEPAKGHQAAAPVKENEVAATCETEGSYDNVVYCSVCNKEMTRTTIKVAALGHDWGPVTYTWASDNSTVTAAKPCRNDSSHNITETVRAASEVITEPDCETTGTTRYTAAFSNSAFTSQTKNVTVAALGHDYETIYEWNYEEGICYAYAYCMRHPNDSSHNVEETSTATRTVTKEATCVDNGSCTLTASFSSSAFSTQTVEDEIPATGVHHYVSTQMIESKTCEHTQYYYIDVCDVCGQIDPNSSPSEAIWEEGPGHDYPASPPNGVAMCSACGDLIVNASYYDNAVYYSINETYVYETMAEAGYTYEGDARLYSYTTGGYLNETGYNWDEYTREIPEEYRNTGERFRIDIFFTNGSYISSNDTTYYD